MDFSLPIPSPFSAADDEQPSTPPTPPRARPPASEQVQVVRELWLLRERGAVSALEPEFLMRLALLLGGGGGGGVRVREARRDEHWVRVEREHDDDGDGDGRTAAPTPVSPTRVREEPAATRTRLGVDAARAQRRVTRLSPTFRAQLEGQIALDEARRDGLVRNESWDDLVAQRAVTGALEGAFRHELEGVLVRRGIRNDTRYYAQAEAQRDHHAHRRHHHLPHPHAHTPPPVVSDPEDVVASGGASGARHEITRLREEVAALKQMMHASFDVQLDIQRAVRQEVAAAMHAHTHGRTKRVDAPPPPPNVPGPSMPPPPSTHSRSVRPLGGGACVICMDANVDSLLYACGHMCCCAACGRQLLANGEPCPICRAPVRDVVVAFLAS